MLPTCSNDTVVLKYKPGIYNWWSRLGAAEIHNINLGSFAQNDLATPANLYECHV